MTTGYAFTELALMLDGVGYSGVHVSLSTLKQWKLNVIALLPLIAYDWPNYETEGSRHWHFFIIVGSTEGLASFPGLRPHFCHSQYGKVGNAGIIYHASDIRLDRRVERI